MRFGSGCVSASLLKIFESDYAFTVEQGHMLKIHDFIERKEPCPTLQRRVYMHFIVPELEILRRRIEPRNPLKSLFTDDPLRRHRIFVTVNFTVTSVEYEVLCSLFARVVAT